MTRIRTTASGVTHAVPALPILGLLVLGLLLLAIPSCGGQTTTTQAAAPTTTLPANSVIIDESADGTTVRLMQGYTLVVRLRANPSTGYAWQVEGVDEATLRLQGDYGFTPDSDLLGAGGVLTALFRAERVGTTVLTMDYVGPDKKVDHTFDVEVIVDPSGGAATDAGGTTQTSSTGQTGATDETTGDGGDSSGSAGDEGDSASAGDSGDDSGDGSATGDGDDSDTTEPTTPSSTVIRLNDDDSGTRVEMRKGDRIVIELKLHPAPDLLARPVEPDRSIFEVLEVRDEGSALVLHYRAVATGKTALVVEYVRRDGSVEAKKWSVKVVVN